MDLMRTGNFMHWVFEDPKSTIDFYGLYSLMSEERVKPWYTFAFFEPDAREWAVQWYHPEKLALPARIKDMSIVECSNRTQEEHCIVEFYRQGEEIADRVKEVANVDGGWMQHSNIEQNLLYPNDLLHLYRCHPASADKWMNYLIRNSRNLL